MQPVIAWVTDIFFNGNRRASGDFIRFIIIFLLIDVDNTIILLIQLNAIAVCVVNLNLVHVTSSNFSLLLFLVLLQVLSLDSTSLRCFFVC